MTYAREKNYRARKKSATPGEILQHAIWRVCARRNASHEERKPGARSAKQAIAIGLSKARRAGVDLPLPKKDRVSEKTRRSAARAYAKGQRGNNETAPRRSRATERALKRERRSAASRKGLSKQARSAARHRPRAARSASARQAARTKGR